MRLFIAINLPEQIKRIISQKMDKIQPLLTSGSPRFSSREDWHLTLTFLGEQPDEAIGPILKAIKETAREFEKPEINFESISYFPPDKPARMVWAMADKETSQILGELKTKLEDRLVDERVKFHRENRPFSAHITLVRFSTTLSGLSDKILAPLSLPFEAQTLDLMESQLKHNGPDYENLSKFAFL